MLGAEIIAKEIKNHGLDKVFLYPGGTIAPILDALDNLQIKLHTTKHEQGAGFAALAAGKLAQKAQVYMVTSGPGVTNAITPLADAYFDSVPLILITGQVGRGDMRGTRKVRQTGFQEIDTCAIAKPITKSVFLPESPDELADIMVEAFRIAEEGRPGPVVIDMPMDVQRSEATKTTSSIKPSKPSFAKGPTPDIETACSWLLGANKPVIIAGNGVRISGAEAELRSIAKGLNSPVSQSLPALGVFPTNDPLALGFHGHTGNQWAGKAIHNADVVFVVGSRLDLRQTGTEKDDFAPNAKIIRIELDPTEIEGTRIESDLMIEGDAKHIMTQMLECIDDQKSADKSAWLAEIDQWKSNYPIEFPPSNLPSPKDIISTVDALTHDEEVVCVSGVGSHQQWTARHFTFDNPKRFWMTSAGHGTMGYDLPAAIGAQIEMPNHKVCCFVGDGSLQMNIQELAFVAHESLPLKIIVLDNERLGIVSQFQLANWETDLTTGSKVNPNFAEIAKAYGIKSFTVDDKETYEATLKEALDFDGPALVHCKVDSKADVSPMLMAGQKMDNMWPYSENT